MPVARQRLGKYVLEAMDTQATIEELMFQTKYPLLEVAAKQRVREDIAD